MVTMLFNITVAIFIGVKQKPGVSRYLLIILSINLAIYGLFYSAMKLKLSLSGDKNKRERINWRSALYFVLGIVLTLIGVSFFALELKSTAKTPSLSRNLNKECALMFFDNHDLWHFASALGLFFIFMAVLTLEDNNNDTPWKEIRVF